MFIKNDKRFNLNAFLDSIFIDDGGIQHLGQLLRHRDFRETHGIFELPDPIRGDDATQYTQEIDVDPWVIITDKSQEQLDQMFNADIKRQIVDLETSQDRAIREAALGDTTRLQDIENQIVALRASFRRDLFNNIIGDI